MWNLRQGFVAAHPTASQLDTNRRFALGSQTKSNEIKRACIDNSWDEQEARFAGILLMNTISVFEDLADNLTDISLSGDNKRRACKALQYPNNGAGRGYQAAYTALDLQSQS